MLELVFSTGSTQADLEVARLQALLAAQPSEAAGRRLRLGRATLAGEEKADKKAPSRLMSDDRPGNDAQAPSRTDPVAISALHGVSHTLYM